MLIQREVERIIKLMNLTTSENDNEALVAIRNANKILFKNKLLWDSIIRKSCEKDEVLNKLDALLNKTKMQQSEHGFISSLNDFYIKNNYLTEKQRQCINKTYNKYYEWESY